MKVLSASVLPDAAPGLIEQGVPGVSEKDGDLLRYAARRLAFVPPGLFVIATLSFFLTHLTPSDPARAVLGTIAPPSAVAQFNHQFGLDRSIWSQYTSYLGHLIRGQLGDSYYTGESVWHAMISRITSSVELIVLALVAALFLGVMVGVMGAYFRGRVGDRAATAVISFGQAVPDFVVGLVASYVLFFQLGLLPAPAGQLSFAATPPPRVTGAALVDSVLAGQWTTARDALDHLVVPVLALTLTAAVVFARVSKSTLGEALDAAHSEYARACGLSERIVVSQALRTITTPLLTYLAVIVAGSIGGVAVVETLVGWQGLGQWAVEAMNHRDLPSVQGIVLLSGTITFIVYIVGDILSGLLDPRAIGT